MPAKRSALVLVSAAVTLSAVIATPVPTASAEAETCNGQTATMVIGEGESFAGTAGADVVVADNANSVRTGAGDDVLCVLGDAMSHTTVEMGEGADHVIVTAVKGSITDVELGTGSDTLVGGDGVEHVTADDHRATSADHDDVRTGAGDDAVYSGFAEQPNDDYVALGTGDDNLSYEGTSVGGGGFEGGVGHDGFIANTDARISVVTPDETMTTDSEPSTHLAGFEDFHLSRSKDVTFRGGPADEELTAAAGADAEMGGGNDTMSVPIDRVDKLSGGAGRDQVQLQQFTTNHRPPRVLVTVDLAKNRLVLTGLVSEDAMLGAEDLDVYGAYSVRVVGDNGPNDIEIHESCVRQVLGRAGNDVIDAELLWCGTGATILGGIGNDRISGTERADVLDGGQGRDRINGRAGRDRCVGEVEKKCER